MRRFISTYYRASAITTVAIALFALLTGCIKNDIPYPYIAVDFLTMKAENETAAAVIDAKTRTVTLTLGETADLSSVKILSYTMTDGAKISNDLTSALDLTKPLSVTLSLYQDYPWTIIANQQIDRYFTIDGQVGASIVDVGGKRVVAYMSKSADLSAVKVTSMKLGPADITTMTPMMTGSTVNFSTPQTVKVKYHNTEETWTIYVQHSTEDVAVTAVDAWTSVIWAYGSAEAGKANGFEYRKVGDAEWTAVPTDWITTDGGSFTACIRHLMPQTSYEVRAVSSGVYSSATQATTGSYFSIPNASFDTWWKDGKIWCPWTESGAAFWGTGNKGATTLGDSNTYPVTDTWDGKSGYAAELDTKFVGISVVGKLAAGNLFVGDYVRTDGTNGILNFGKPCTQRPTRLKGYWKYTTAPINYTSSEYKDLKGRPDTAVVYIALADWTAPYEIRTNPSNRQLFDKNASYVIAYGEVTTGKTIPSWTQFTAELKYRSTSRVPSYILIVCTASKYGDFFTGGAGSTLLVDNFSLEWDY